MHAIVAPRYGSPDVLELRERIPPPPGANDVRVRVHAAGVNPADVHLLRGRPLVVRLAGHGLLRPRRRVPGSDVAGRIEAVGAAVRRLRPGDAVFADLSDVGGGAFAETVVAPADVWVPKPAGLSFAAAAAAPMAAVTALQGLRAGGLDEGSSGGREVLIHGASGGVGTFAVQIARTLGARVTGVCSGRNAELVRGLGAERVIDYTREDWSAPEARYDLVFDTVGTPTLARVRRILKPRGAFVTTAFLPWVALRGPGLARREGLRLRNLMANVSADDLARVASWLESGRVAPVLDRCYPLARAADALRYVAGRRARGKVVITV